MNHCTIPRLLFITLCLFLPNLAISGEALNESTPVITEKGAHYSVWSKTVEEQLPDGKVVNRIHSYTEWASGLNYWSDEQKNWLPSTEEVEIVNGAAVARHGSMQVIWTANPNVAGAVDLQTAEGLRFQSHVLGIAFTDARTGASAFIANLKDCVGEVSGNSVIYRNAFDSISADIIYVYKRGSFEQNILLKEALPDPTQPPWNMDPSTVRVEIFTEFIDPPQAEVTTTVLKQETDPAKRQLMAEPDLTDDQLNFGTSIIGRGTAFLTGLPGDAENVSVTKVFEVREKNRHVLVERVEYNAIMAQLGALPRAAAVTRERMASIEQSRDKKGIPKLSLPRRSVKTAKLKTEPMRTAQLSGPLRGLLVDYSLLTSITGAVLKADQTYYISGQVTLSTPATFEGGVVIKYAPTNSASIKLTGATTFLSSPYRMIHLTARDDHSIGEQIGTNALSGYYASTALELASTMTLSYARISYATLGIQFSASGCVLMHSQIVNCNKGAYYFNANDIAFRNVLACSLNTAVTGNASGPPIGRWEHVTLDKIGSLNPSATCNLFLTNCLLVSITNTPSMYDYSGAYNATNSSSAAVFQTLGVGAGGHYLATNSSYRNIGTRNITSALALDLNAKTTYAPILMAVDGWYATNLTLSPVAQRDTDTPDLGYHYDPLDYCISGMALSNATLTLQGGVAIGTFQSSPNITYSICPLSNARLYSQGSPTNLNHIVRFNTAQELVYTNWSARGASVQPSFAVVSPQSEARLSFTEWSTPASDTMHIYGYAGGNSLPIVLTDNQFHGGTVDSELPGINVTNCLFDRVLLHLVDGNGAFDCSFQNNLFYGGTNWLDHSDPGHWGYRDNFFYETKFIFFANPVDADYNNGYLTNSQHLVSVATNNVLVLTNSSINFQTSWLGRYYLPTNSLLIDRGSTNASAIGLYHYTSVTNQMKETNSTVNIGFHYVAVDSVTGIPTDSDGDGLPDYIEDANGNGVVDTGETNWMAGGADSDGDGISDGWEVFLGLDPLVNDNAQPGSRSNYSYDLLDWLEGITGVRTGSVSLDAEGNVLSVSQ